METVYKTKSKFSAFDLDKLIVMIQRETVSWEKEMKNPKRNNEHCSKLARELNEARGYICGELKKKDRMYPLFFPRGSLVEYKRSHDRGTTRMNAKVVGHTESKVLIEPEGEGGMNFEVEPQYLTLRFMRTKY